MFENYLKVAIRNIKKHKAYSFINVTGLAVGIACCIFILLFVRSELSCDRFHDKAERIYRVGMRFNVGANQKMTGLVKEFPMNSHFHFDFLASFSSLPKSVKSRGSF
ncbi:MAG: ABC transporter permease [Candidatus Aminicenantes bacterium]|nr:ABC transporter permease [Candidatus Aminicenantes bacterium]